MSDNWTEWRNVAAAPQRLSCRPALNQFLRNMASQKKTLFFVLLLNFLLINVSHGCLNRGIRYVLKRQAKDEARRKKESSRVVCENVYFADPYVYILRTKACNPILLPAAKP